MKKKYLMCLPIAGVLFLASCGGEKETKAVEKTAPATEEVAKEKTTIDGADLFASSGCVACHQAAVKTVGPSIKEIKAAYVDNAAGLEAFLNGEADPIIDVAQAAVMSPQVEVTKAMSAEERAAIADYLLK